MNFRLVNRRNQEKTKSLPPVSLSLFIPLLWFGERACVIDGTVFILFNHFNTQLMLLVYLILYGKLSFNDSHLVINHKFHCYLLK